MTNGFGLSLLGGLGAIGNKDTLAANGFFGNEDIQAVQNFAKVLDETNNKIKAFDSTMLNASSSCQKYVQEGLAAKKTGQEIAAGMKSASISTNIATVATNALSAALTSLAIGAVIFGVTQLIKYMDETARHVEITKEKVSALKDEFHSALDTANSNLAAFDKIIDRGKELSKGVDDLGNNISLTTEEFEEYKNIVDQIAEMSPNLVKGYTNEGQAIIDLKDNVDELRDSYIQAKREAYNLLVATGENDNGKNIIQQFKDTREKGMWESNLWGEDFNSNDKRDLANLIKTSTGDMEDILALIENFSKTRNMAEADVKEFLNNELGLSVMYDTFNGWTESTVNGENNLAEIKTAAKAIALQYQTEINSAISDVKLLGDAYLQNALLDPDADYKYLSNSAKTIASKIVQSMDEELAAGFEDDTSVGKYVYNILDDLDQMSLPMQSKLAQLVSGTLNNEELHQAYQELLDYLQSVLHLDPNNPLISYVRTEYLDQQEVGQKTEELVVYAATRVNFSDTEESYESASKKLNDFIEEAEIDSEEEVEKLRDCLERAGYDLGMAFDMYLGKLEESSEKSVVTISESIRDMNTQIKPFFDTLGDLYLKIFDGGEFNFENIDTAALAALEQQFNEISEDLQKELGDAFDPTIVEKFFSDIKNASNTKEAQDAVNEFAGAWLYNTQMLEDVNAETEKYIERMLELSGVTNAHEIVQAQVNANLEAQENKTKALAAATEDMKNNTMEATAQFLQEAQMTNLAKIELADYIAKETIFNNSSLDVSDRIAKLSALAGAYMNAAAKAEFLNMTSQAIPGENISPDAAWAQLVEKYMNYELPEMQYTAPTTGGGGGGGGSSEAEEMVDEYEEALKILDQLRDNDVIDAKTYLDQKRKLIEDFYKKGVLSAEQYFQKMHDLLRELLDFYNSVISDITSILQEEIDKLEDERNERIEQIEKERDAALEAIDEEIKKLDKKIKKKSQEIEKIKEANEQRQREIDLQKKLYELERARYQRVNLVYKEGPDGKSQMVYTNDPNAVRDKQNEVEQAKYEERLAVLEKELDLLNEEKDKLSEQRQEIEEHYQKLIDETNEYYDNAIKKIQDYIKLWEDLEKAESRALRLNRLSSLGISMDAILSLDQGTFDSFKQNYLGILGDIYRENGNMQESFANAYGELPSYLNDTAEAFGALNGIDLTSFSNALESLQSGVYSLKDCSPETMQGAVDGIGTVTDAFTETEQAVRGVTTAINGAGGSASGTTTQTGTQGTGTTGTTGTGEGEGAEGGTLTEAIDTAAQAGDQVSGKLKGDFETLKNYITAELIPVISDDSTNSLYGALRYVCDQEYGIEIGVSISDQTGGLLGQLGWGTGESGKFSLPTAGAGGVSIWGTGTVGSAFYDGYPGLTQAEHDAIRSEFGQPELTVYPNGTYEITTTPTISDLPKGTVIFSEEQTRRILRNNGKGGKAFANGTGSSIVPLQDAMPEKYAMMESIQASLRANMDKLVVNVADMTRNVGEIATAVTNIQNVGGTTTNFTGDINVTCPGVTSEEVARSLPTALRTALANEVTGMALKANQRASRR